MASMVSAPATIPATNAATFTSALDPAAPGTRTWARARSCSPARSARVMTGINPAHDTRFGSSKPAERLWQDRIYRVSFCLVRRSPQETPSSQVKRTFVCHDPLRTPTSPVDRGSVALPQGLLTLGFDPSRFQTEPPACYRASWQPPGPDLHRRATTGCQTTVSYTHLRAHETRHDLVCRLLLEK